MDILIISQIIVSIFLVVFILFQQRGGSALGSAFGGGGGGGGDEGGDYSIKRGIQQKFYWATIICGTLFLILALLSLVY